MRLIDADTIKYKQQVMYKKDDSDDVWAEWFTTATEIANAPTVDAVQVVRCKDCKHLKASMGKVIVNGEEEVFIGDSWCSATYPMVTVFNMDHFCSYGERKDNETDAADED